MLNMSNNGHENADGQPSQKAIKWILVDSAIIGLIAVGAVMPMGVPTWSDAWVMFRAFFIALIYQLAVERALKRPRPEE